MDVKLAVLGNDARVATETSAAFNGVLNEGASRGQTCFMADIAPVLRFDITEHLSLRLGYYAMYLSGVALAPENFVPTPPPGAVGRTPQINTSGHTVYHGLTVGAEYRF